MPLQCISAVSKTAAPPPLYPLTTLPPSFLIFQWCVLFFHSLSGFHYFRTAFWYHEPGSNSNVKTLMDCQQCAFGGFYEYLWWQVTQLGHAQYLLGVCVDFLLLFHGTSSVIWRQMTMHLRVYVIVSHPTTDMSQVYEAVDWCKTSWGKTLHIDDR